jgi:hypothetical protein
MLAVLSISRLHVSTLRPTFIVYSLVFVFARALASETSVERDFSAEFGSFSGSFEDLVILGIPQLQIPKCFGLERKLIRNPAGRSGRELGVYPDSHAAIE